MQKQSKNSKIKVQPLADRVLVKRTEMPDKKTASGLIIPDTAQKEKSKMGVVLAVGPGRVGKDGKRIPIGIKVGAEVIFNTGWDTEVKIGNDDDELFLVKEEEILAVVL
jgi:chaperonin GroES